MKNHPSDQWAFVTGASSGIGAEFARQLAEKKYNLILLARREEKLKMLANELEERHSIKIKILVIDLTNPNFLEEIKQGISNLNISIVISNAGAAVMGALSLMNLNSLEKMVDLNVKSQLRIAHYFTNYFKLQKRMGKILLVSSSVAFQGVPYSANYSGAKAYILNLGEALHYELKKDNITITVLTPGPTKAPGLTDRIDADLSKMPMKPQEVDQLVREGLVGLFKGKPLVIGGRMNRMMVGIGKRLLSRATNVKLWGKLMKGMVKVK